MRHCGRHDFTCKRLSQPPLPACAGAAGACILRSQILQEGKPTVWCAQHDEKSFTPAWARKYEPPSLSGSESVDIVCFLRSVERPTPKIIAAVEGAVAWLRTIPLRRVRLDKILGADRCTERRLVDPAATAVRGVRIRRIASVVVLGPRQNTPRPGRPADFTRVVTPP